MMKNLIKSKSILLLIIGLLVLGLSACGQSTVPQEPADPSAGNIETPSATEKVVNLGIIQLVTHPSLDAAREGFMDILKANGYEEGKQLKVVLKNGQGEVPITQSIAQQLSQDKLDLILAIATPAAQAMANATKDTPILITAVTDPVAAKLVQSLEKPGTNVSGTSDYVSIAEQLGLVREIMPNLKRLGVIYNSGEENSLVQVGEVKKYAKDNGITVVEATPTNSSEVLQAAQSLIGKVDAIYVPTDNTVVSALEAVIKVSYDNKIPMFPGEGDSVARGGVATAGVDYYKLGEQTGLQALKILSGVKAADIPIETQEQVSVIVNLVAAEKVGIEIPKEVMDRAVEIITE